MLSSEIAWAVGRVLTDPQRLRFLAGGGLDDALELRRFLIDVVPLARTALARLEMLADRIPDERLRALAFSSLRSKAYHVAGACILATFLPAGARQHYVDVVAPLETIYDFLDTLCDRHPQTGEQSYRQLHEALFDALDPSRELHQYYAFGPAGDDGDYLHSLVRLTRRALTRLADYELLLPYFSRAAGLYADTQTYSHLPAGKREAACIAWHARESAAFGDLSWWEFGAAAGSQFHVYAPLYELFCSDLDRIGPAFSAYFPAMSALHVLLDSFIDQAEDREHGELNWVAQYPSRDAFLQRMHTLAQRAKSGFDGLGLPRAHTFTLRVMILFYLTHPKVHAQGIDQDAIALLRELA